MILDNINKIVNLLDFNRTDRFFYLEIIQRKKDNSNITKDRKIYQRFISSVEELYKNLDDIKLLCKVYNARTYISLNARSNEKFTKECLKAYTERVCSNNYKNTFLIPEKIVLLPQCKCGNGSGFWILDVDIKDKDYINRFKEIIDKNLVCVYETLNTPNGYHLVVDPFNLKHKDLIYLKDDNFKFNEFEFTLRQEALTIIYADIN